MRDGLFFLLEFDRMDYIMPGITERPIGIARETAKHKEICGFMGFHLSKMYGLCGLFTGFLPNSSPICKNV